ncbi:hypothetical protein RsoM2USA_78 [Ralstonia phage RsoM2USA]|nr:hypothetical protein RsoM2USA_78 [Ralstonia phage RsoM2USA]
MHNMTATQWHGLGVEEIMDLTKQQVTALRRAAGERIVNPVTNEDKIFNQKQEALQKECNQALVLKNTTRPDIDPKTLIKRRK